MKYTLLLTLSFAAIAQNPRIELLKSFYGVQLDRHLKAEVDRLLDETASQINRQIEKASHNIETIVYESKQEHNEFKTRTFNNNVGTRYDHFQLLLEGTLGDIHRIAFYKQIALSASQIDKDTLCSQLSEQIVFPGRPEYRRVKVDIPKPDILRQIGIFDSQYKPAEETAGTVFTASSSGGCLAGGVIGSIIPVLGTAVGCLVGAVAGTVIGLGAGALKQVT